MSGELRRSGGRCWPALAFAVLASALAGCTDTGLIGHTQAAATCAMGCEAPSLCHPELGTCTDCIEDPDCDGGDALYCEMGTCIECRSEADCELDEPYCIAGQCVECLEDLDCADDDDEPICEDGECVEVGGDDD